MRNVIVFVSMVLCTACYAYPVLKNETNYESVSIYFVDWGFQPRYALHPNYVRENPHLTAVVYSQVYIHNIESWLNVSLMEPISDIENFYLGEIRDRREVADILSKEENIELIDARLVIELHRRDGVTETYISDGNWLYDSTAESAREIDQEFKERVDALVGGPVNRDP